MLRSFTGSSPGRLLLALLGVSAVFAVVAVAGIALAVAGGPGSCSPGGGPVTVSDAGAHAFQSKWRAFEDTVDGGTPASVTLSESEVTSRAQERLHDDASGLHDLRICLHDGYAEATATLDVPAFFNVRGKVKGDLELASPHARGHIEDVELGSIPGPLLEPPEALLRRAVDEVLDDIEVEPRAYTITFTEGAVRVDAEPLPSP
ncbi:MAG: hypothetical protein WEE64_08275 [Dehalococcoidia bacterium]